MIVLDTSSVGGQHSLREPSRAVIEAAAAGRIVATTTVAVLQEFVPVRSRRRTRGDAVGLAKAFAAVLQPLLVVDENDLHAGLDLYDGQTQLGAFDCVLAAVALRRGAESLVSGDNGFATVPGLRAFRPDASAVEVLLS